MNIYLAGPLFTPAERELNTRVADALRRLGHEVFVPQEEESKPRQDESLAQAIFETDRRGIDWAHVVLANLDGPDPDSGTSWECGYAYAKDKPVIAYRTDFRLTRDMPGVKVNLMLDASVVWIPVEATPNSRMDAIVSSIVLFFGTK